VRRRAVARWRSYPRTDATAQTCVVNTNVIAGVTRDLRGRVALKLKSRPEKLAVSEAHVHLFRQM
jgi:DNA-binding LytR/AlgR family response regulator